MSDEVPTAPWGNPDPAAAPPPVPSPGAWVGPPPVPGQPPPVPGQPPPTWVPTPGAGGPPGTVPPMGWSPPGSGPTPYAGPPKRDGQAVGSIVLGVLSLLCPGFLGVFFGAGAVVTGYLSRKRIIAASGLLEGRGLAVTGMVLGSIGIVVGSIAFVYVTFVNPDWATEVFDNLAPSTTAGSR